MMDNEIYYAEPIDDGTTGLLLELKPDLYQRLIEYVSSCDGLDLHKFCADAIEAWIKKDKFERGAGKFHDKLAGIGSNRGN